MQSNRGPRGIPGAMVAGYFDYHRIPNVDPQGGWASQTFTASGIFTAPMNGVFLNKNRKVDCYITATAAGGASRTTQSFSVAAGGAHSSTGGGDAGDWVLRYKIALFPGEQVAVTIPGMTSTDSNGSSLVFGSYLTLSGGNKGAADTNSSPVVNTYTDTNGGAIISGSISTDNAIHRGSRGGVGGGFLTGNNANLNGTHGSERSQQGTNGQSNHAYTQSLGGKGSQSATYIGNPLDDAGGGGGGAGLFGAGGDAGVSVGAAGSDAAANSGAGGGGAHKSIASDSGVAGAKGGSGQLIVEWRIPA